MDACIVAIQVKWRNPANPGPLQKCDVTVDFVMAKYRINFHLELPQTLATYWSPNLFASQSICLRQFITQRDMAKW